MKTILITGVAGFIGSNLADYLLEQGFTVIGIDNYDDLYDRKIKEKNISEALKHPRFLLYNGDLCGDLSPLKALNFDLVVHLAAKAGIPNSIGRAQEYLETNLLGTNNLLKFMQAQGCKNIIFSSSSSVYGNSKHPVLSESDRTNSPLSPYATSKKSGELLCYNYHHLFKFNVIILRLFSVYGKRQRPDLAMSIFAEAIHRNQPVPILGDGSACRDFTEIRDVIQAINQSIGYLNVHAKKKNIYEIFNIGNGRPVSIFHLAELMFQAFGKPLRVKYLPLLAFEMNRTCADIAKAQQLLKYQPSVLIEEGVLKFTDWYQQN